MAAGIEAEAFRQKLLAWYDAGRRDLPWRQSTDFYPVWISEVMLQQTRVEAAIPHYLRFLLRFPSLAALAMADEADVLAAWSGLGYYRRARNLHKAARQVAEAGIPRSHGEILALPGAGPYTAAAVASIALGLPHAAVDGNVIRVTSRLSADSEPSESPETRRRLAALADSLLDRARPGDFNQAMMELGATVCTPAGPQCVWCPVSGFCGGYAAGIQASLPVRHARPQSRRRELCLLLLRRKGDGGGDEVFLVRRDSGESRLAGFWEPLPYDAAWGAAPVAANFTHQIVNDRYSVSVREKWHGADSEPTVAGRWFPVADLPLVPLGGIARKAIDAVLAVRPTSLFDTGE